MHGSPLSVLARARGLWYEPAGGDALSEFSPSTSFQSIHPVLPAEDLEASLAYYTRKLGFEVAWKWGDPPFRAGVSRGPVEIQLDADPDTRKAPGQVYLHVTGVDAYFAACVEAGAEIASPLEARPWKMKDFRVDDPGGNRLGFGEPV